MWGGPAPNVRIRVRPVPATEDPPADEPQLDPPDEVMEQYEREVMPVSRVPVYCAAKFRTALDPRHERVCGGLLLPSTYGGFMHAYDTDDHHTPVTTAGNPIGPDRAPARRRFRLVAPETGEEWARLYAGLLILEVLAMLVLAGWGGEIIFSTWVTMALVAAALMFAIGINLTLEDGERQWPLRWVLWLLGISIAINFGGALIAMLS